MSAVLQKASPVTIEVVEQAARFRDLRQEWNALLQASASDCLFLTWEWLYTWWQCLSGKNSLFLLLVRFGEELVAIAPMMIRPRQLTRLLPFQTLEFLGTGSAGSDYLDLIIRRGMEEPVALHHRRWRPRGGSDALHTENLIAFHREFTRTALERGWLRLFTLWLGEKPAASLYGFRYGRTFYFYQSGFDPAYAKNSVGLVTMGLSIESALEEGAEEYDL